ncbi:MAG: L-lactate dehydrogenase [Pseudomonadales bacterium]|nr:L-lactate dehydrogenase [Candidatus Woesebacteria bacterium]MCB9802084.1 L-lactate dehydrogenase [Pseudomonadales bacterium]
MPNTPSLNKQNTQLNKVAIVGCGRVGMTAAFSILHTGDVNELVLHGRCKDDLIGEQLDLEHAMGVLHPATITATERYEDLAGCDIVVYAAGASQKPGETRLDLTEKNKAILESILPHIIKHAPEAVILIVANPVDILTYHAYRIAGWPKGRIFGSGTTLDTQRFRFHLSELLHVSPSSVHAYILGEHGDHSFPTLSTASVGGQPLLHFPTISEQQIQRAYEQARNAAYRIIDSKGATYYGIGAVVSHIVSCILSDNKTVLPLSIPLHQYYGQSGVAASVPCVVGRGGVEDTLEIKLSWEEKQQFEQAVRELKKYC